LSAAISAALLLGLSLGTPAYAAQPESSSGKKATISGTAQPSSSTTSTQPRGQASGHATSGTSGTSGSVTEPQPRSHADQNGGGANHPGPYDSTRSGLPSGNGNGTGKATGKPCAGCVGKADNKNPKGQYPNGSDHNAGYECDRNHGIGRTNPAHTGCRPTPPPPCVDNPATPQDECSTPPPCVDNPETPQDECSTPPPCVDNPATPDDECGTVSPPCVDNPLTEQDECGEVSPPSTCVDDVLTPEDECGTVSPPEGGPTPPAATTAPPSAAVLPPTGAPVGVGLTAVLGMLLLLGGALVAGRIRRVS